MLSIFKKPPSSESFVDVTANAQGSGDALDWPDPSAEASTWYPDGDTATQQQPLSPTTNDKAEKKTKGGLCSIRTLYERAPDDWPNTGDKFQAEYPTDLIRKGPAPDKISANRLYALVVRERRTGLKNKPLRMDTVTVQSPHVKAALASVLDNYHNVGQMKLRNPVFARPFRELYHAWPAFEEMVKKESGDGAGTEAQQKQQHLQLFYDLAKRDVERLRRKQLPLDRQHKVTFDTLFVALQPGTVIYSKEGGGRFDRFFKLTSVEYGGVRGVRPSVCYVHCIGLEWNGTELGGAPRSFSLSRWPGAKRLTELEVFPAELHPDYNTIRAQLLERGRRWDAMREKPTVVEYEGSTPERFDSDRWGRGGGVRMVRGRVVIDPAAYEAYGGRRVPLDYDEIPDDIYKPSLFLDNGEGDEDDEDVVAGDESDSDSDDDESGKQAQDSGSAEDDFQDTPLSDDMLVLASHEIYGFYLKTKTWVKLYIDFAKDVPWNHQAFDRLVLPGNFKQLILAFVESQAQNRDVFDDIIEGKGQGIIMLLHGAPGLGKTLTAEAVADRMKKPLYSVQAGELGSKADEVEKKLELILEMAAKWDAVLLLDEADVFLEQRHHSDLERNKIVSIFLRLLEYYRGTLFLTSNRVESFDEAFRSRIHLKINYPTLNTEAKIGIWKNFIETSRKKNGSNMTERDIRELAELPFNGREIKNMVKTAQLLASREKWLLEMRHFKVCLDVLEAGKGEQGETLMI